MLNVFLTETNTMVTNDNANYDISIPEMEENNEIVDWLDPAVKMITAREVTVGLRIGSLSAAESTTRVSY